MRKWTPKDMARFRAGQHFELHQLLGAHWLGPHVVFRVWAPEAVRVVVVGDFNDWDATTTPMTRVLGSDVWRIVVPGVAIGSCYKFRIQGPNGQWVEKADPMAISSEVPSLGLPYCAAQLSMAGCVLDDAAGTRHPLDPCGVGL